MIVKKGIIAFVLSLFVVCLGGFGNALAAPIVVDFELEIELKDDSKYDIEYEVRNGMYDAKFQVPGSPTVYGQEALTKIEALLNELQLTPDMNKKKLRSDILTIFNVDKNNIDEFDLEVKFDNGKKLEINR